MLDQPSELHAFQESKKLIGFENRDGAWRIESIGSAVTLKTKTDTFPYEFPKSPLPGPAKPVFKLGVDPNSDGSAVRRINAGWYIVVVPDTWFRDEEYSGPAPFEPEQIRGLRRWFAHYFYVGRDGRHPIGFTDESGRPCRASRVRNQFMLEGIQAPAQVSFRCPVFLEKPPRLTSRSADGLGLDEIVVGREGAGRRKWRETRRIASVESGIGLWASAEEPSGWYFARLYQNAELIDSLDYCVLTGVSSISVEPLQVLPAHDGHAPARIEFAHREGVTIAADIGTGEGLVELSHLPKLTAATVPPDALLNETEWEVADGAGAGVRLRICLPRVWWTFAAKDVATAEFTDRPLALALDDLGLSTRKSIIVRCPSLLGGSHLVVGFRGDQLRTYPVPQMGGDIHIRLHDFEGATACSTPGPHELSLDINEYGEKVILALLAVRVRCKTCGQVSDTEADSWTHIAEKHVNELFRELTYEEMRRQVPTLPHKIVECPYCSEWIACTSYRDDYKMEEHAAQMHRDMGPPSIRIIENLDEIRNLYQKDLPDLRICTLCPPNGATVVDTTKRQAMLDHLQKEHQRRLVEFA